MLFFEAKEFDLGSCLKKGGGLDDLRKGKTTETRAKCEYGTLKSLYLFIYLFIIRPFRSNLVLDGLILQTI